MEKKLSILFIIFSVLSIFSIFLDAFEYYNFSTFLTFFYFRNLNIRFYNLLNLNLIDLMFSILFLVGSFKYYFSEFKDSRLLKFIVSIILFSKIIFIFLEIINLVMLCYFNNTLIAFNIFYYVFQISIIVFCFKFLNFLIFKKDFNKNQIQEMIEFIRVSKIKRFLNVFIDDLVILLISLCATTQILQFYYFEIVSTYKMELIFNFNETFIHVLGLLFFRIIYYLFFEGFFKASPGKFITVTRVVDINGEKLSFHKILLRTVLRFLPFDSITFLFGYNLHDNWSSTVVFQEIRES